MRTIFFLHRWTGGLLGFLLAMLGATGTLLLQKDWWLRWTLPYAADPPSRSTVELATSVSQLFGDPAKQSTAIVLASDRLGVDRVVYAGSDAGAYVNQAGTIVTDWSSIWQRPELWLFDLHHHLLSGDTGQTIAGIVGLLGILFVLTGSLMWWRTRQNFRFRLLPKRFSRAAIIRHHRDLGIVIAPLLLVSFLSGTMMALRPIEQLVLRPFVSPAALAESRQSPALNNEKISSNLDWLSIISAAHQRFPNASLRVISRPITPGAPITVRMRQPTEWLPDGATRLWFDPSNGRLIGMRDATSVSFGVGLANKEYPIHAAKTGGLIWRLALTFSGLGLTLLGTFAVLTFWLGKTGNRTTQLTGSHRVVRVDF